MNKRLKILAILGVILLIGVITTSCGGDSDSSYDWPDNTMSQMLPEPEGDITWLSTTDGEFLYADVDCDTDEYKSYVDACKDKGFDIDPKSSQNDDSYEFEAKNKEGDKLSLEYFADSMSIKLDAAAAQEETTEAATEATKATTKASSEGKVSPDFKKTMDSYEAFMDEYIAFMEKYEDSDDVASMLSDYADMMEQYSDYMEKIDAIDEDSLSDADLAYYLKVTARVEKKLAKATF